MNYKEFLQDHQKCIDSINNDESLSKEEKDRLLQMEEEYFYEELNHYDEAYPR